MNNPRAHIQESRVKGYIPFSNFRFQYDEYAQVLVPDHQNALRIHLGYKWRMEDKEKEELLKEARTEVAKSIIEGRRPNRVFFGSMGGGFDHYQTLVSGFFKNGYELNYSNYFLTLKNGIKDSSAHVGRHGIALDLAGGLSGGQVLELKDWFDSLKTEARRRDPHAYIIEK